MLFLFHPGSTSHFPIVINYSTLALIVKSHNCTAPQFKRSIAIFTMWMSHFGSGGVKTHDIIINPRGIKSGSQSPKGLCVTPERFQRGVSVFWAGSNGLLVSDTAHCKVMHRVGLSGRGVRRFGKLWGCRA
jgi:hypothetical protein